MEKQETDHYINSQSAADNPSQLGPVVVKLMKGVVYRDEQESLWQDLLLLEHHVRDYLGVIGLDMVMDEPDGYAYLKQMEIEDGHDNMAQKIPRLMQRRPLSYPVSLLCVLLRKKLVEADVAGEERRVILTREQMAEMMRVFFKDQPNEAKLVDRVDATINKVVDLGFLHRFEKDGQTFEIRRILKDLVNADWLANLDEKLEEYRVHAVAD